MLHIITPSVTNNGIIIDQNLDEENRGYTVLHVWGSNYEMGYARAELLGEYIIQELNLVKSFFGADYSNCRDAMEFAY